MTKNNLRGWAELTAEERLQAVRLFRGGTKYEALWETFQIDKPCRATFDRRMREGTAWAEALGVTNLPDGAPADPVPLLNGIDLTQLARAIRNQPRTLRELSREFDRAEETVREALDALKAQHYNVVETARRVAIDTHTAHAALPKLALDADAMIIPLAIASDIHVGSTGQQITALQRFEREAVERYAVKAILHPGDILAGCGVYRGQAHDLYLPTPDAQIEGADRVLRAWPGVKRIVLGGNHDFSTIKASGHDALKALCARRKDMLYCGYDAYDLALTDKADLRLWHPSGGPSYAVSYRLQKGIESVSFEELQRAIDHNETPNLRGVLAGHLHVECELQRGPIFGMQCGCFEGQTNYLKAKGLYPQIGGFIVWLTLTDGGLIARRRFEFIPFREIRDDWKNYPELWEDAAQATAEPLFEWQAGEMEPHAEGGGTTKEEAA